MIKIYTKVFITRPDDDIPIALPIDEVMKNFAIYASHLTEVFVYKYWGALYIEQFNQKLFVPAEMPASFLFPVLYIFPEWQNKLGALNDYCVSSEYCSGDKFYLIEVKSQEQIELSYKVIHTKKTNGLANQKIVVDYWQFFEQAFLNIEKIIAYYRCFIPYEGEEPPHTTHHENMLRAAQKLYAQKYAAHTLRKNIDKLIEKKKNGHLLIREQTQLEYLQKIQAANTNIELDALLIEIQNIYGVDNETRKYIFRICQTKINNL